MPDEPTVPEFTDNFATLPAANVGPKRPDGSTIGVGLPVGEDIIITNKEGGSDYMFYGLLEDANGNIVSVAWDGFNTGLPKEGVLVVHTKKGITVTTPQGQQNVDVNIPAGAYKMVLRDDPSPSGEILGETDYFVLY